MYGLKNSTAVKEKTLESFVVLGKEILNIFLKSASRRQKITYNFCIKTGGACLKMRFQQLVFRTTPHSLVEWLDGELEKRGIDCVYTHCILSILQEDSCDTEPDECFDVRNNQQKVYQKYGGPESLFSATKSKHQKWKTYSKQILLTGSISSCDIGISDLERKNRNAAINCLKSVSDDNTIEDLIEEVCLKLKNLKNVNALEKKDSVKSSNRVDKETAFYIPPSSPTDQVEKYFAAFPPLNNNFEEKNLSDEFIHVNAWYNNCLRKNKTIVQDIFKNSQISSENSRGKNDICGSLKSIENIYQPDNKSLNRCKIHNMHKQDNSNLKFSDENAFTEISVKSNIGDVSNSTLTNMLSKFKKDPPVNLHFTLNIDSENSDATKKKNSFQNSSKYDLCCKKCKFTSSCLNDLYNHKCLLKELAKSIANSKIVEKYKDWESQHNNCTKCKNFKSLKNSDTPVNANELFSHESLDSTSENDDVKSCEKNENVSSNKAVTCLKSKHRKKSLSISSDLNHHKSVIEELSKSVVSSTKNSENVKNWESLSSQDNNFTPRKKFKSPKNSDTSINANEFFSNESLDSTSKNVDVKSCEENENASSNKAVTCLKSKHRKKSLSKDNCSTMRNDFNQLMFNNLEKQSENIRKEFEYSEVAKKDTRDKMPKIAVEQLKTNSKKRKSKSRLKKCSSVEQKNLEFLKPKVGKLNDVTLKDVDVTESFSSKNDHIFINEWLEGTEKEMSVTKVQLNVKDSLEFEGNDCNETLYVSRYNIKNTSNTKEETYLCNDSLEKPNLYLSRETEVEVSTMENICNKSKTIDISENTFTVKTKKSNSELNCSPALNEIPRHKLIFPFGNINLIKIDTNVYYNFDPLRALSFFSENEIFNIITAGDLNEVNNFLSKFSTPHNKPVYEAQGIVAESKQETNNYSLPSQEMLTDFDNFDSRKNIDGEPLLRITPSCSLPKIYCSKLSTSFSLKDLQSKESDGVNSLPDKYCDEIAFKSTNMQEKITNGNTSVLFKDWDYNLFFDFNEEKSKSSSCFAPNDYFNVAYPSFSVSDSFTVKSISDVRPNKKVYDEDIFSVGLSNNCCTEDKYISPCTITSTNNFAGAIKEVSHDFKGKYVSCVLENESKQTDSFYCFFSPKETIVENISDAKVGSAFKPASKVIPASFRKGSQKILTKAINIDRIIQKINGKNRVASFEHLQNLSFLDHPNVDEQISSHSLINLLGSTSNYSDKKVGTENFMVTDSDWSKQFLMKKENLKSIWEPKMNCIDSIWGSPTKDVKKSNEPVSSDFNNDEIHEEFEKEQEELLRGLYSMPHLKEETDLTYSFEQNVSNPIYECPYETNTDLTNESLNTDEYSRICHTMPAQTISKLSKSNNNLSFSFSEPSVDPVGSFSLDSCKSEAVNSQISCSDNFSDYIKNESYQESDFIDLSAFRGPYGSFSENRSNAIECGGWSLDSDSYLLESEGIQDQSSSLQDLNTMGAENDHFLYMPIDRQQFSSEDDEMTKFNEARWPTGFMRRRMKHKCPPFKRPCAFYMEGHCNRADCKFSHELSNITCRFWQEGSCFKGSTCPFLHGYAEELKTDQHRSFHKREPEYNYSLDSESDFPSLSSSKTEKPVVVKSEPVDIIRVKGFKNSRQTNH